MRIILADCEVVYTGRGDTRLPRGVRAVMIKEDGAVAIHNDAGTKPLNYMAKGNSFSIDGDVWSFDTTKESLQVHMRAIYSDISSQLADSCELERDGTEKQLQAWIAENPEEAFGEGWAFREREYNTGEGPVDLLMENPDGLPVIVEVKRVATKAAVTQILRYMAGVKEQGVEAGMMIAALDCRPSMVKYAEKKEIPFTVIKKSWNE